MKVYQVVVFEEITLSYVEPAPEMRSYEMFQNRENAKAFFPSAIAHYRKLYELSEDVEVHGIIDEYEVMDMNTTWDPIGGRPINPDVMKAAAMDEEAFEMVNNCLDVVDAYDYHRDDWEY